MKKQLLLTLALGLAGAASATAATTVDVYITGSTAFRANCYTACQKLFVGSAPSVYYGDAAHGGANSGFSSKTTSWVMTGTPISSLTTMSGDTLVIHGLFTGSVQGVQAVENVQQLVWAQPVGTINGNATQYVTNSATIAFSDASSVATPYPADGVNYIEENVCVQPFVIAKSQGGGAVTNITNVTWEQMEYGIPNGRIPVSAWTYNAADTNNFVYLLQRTADSGTRRCETQGNYYQFNDPVGIYCYDYTNNFFYTPTVATNFTFGVSNATVNAGVIGSEGPGLGNANMNWGFGYIGGGDIANTLNNPNAANEAIAVLSMGDSKSVGPSGSNWANVVSFNGVWPTRAGVGIHGNSGTNDFSPITDGYYPIWGYEVIVFPSAPPTGQNISASQLGNNLGSAPGSFISIFNAQTLINGGSPVAGSIENEIVVSQPSGATGIPLAAMLSNRSAVGGLISPF